MSSQTDLSPEFVAAINDAIKFGDASYISSVFEILSQSFHLLTWEMFCEELVELNQGGIIELRRLDLVTAADRELVAASEIRYLTEEYHLVKLS